MLFLCQMSKQMEVIINVISSYLAENRRITVPTLGAFLTKGDGVTILFSEFMKGDDGVLRDLLKAKSGVGDAEATKQIDRFVEEVHRTLLSGESFDMSSLGALVMDGETIQLVAHSNEVEVEQNQVVSLFDLLSQEEMEQDDDEQEQQEASKPAEPQNIAPPKPTTQRPKYDVWLVSAVAAGVFAIFALFYGLIVEWQIGNISFGGAIDDFLYRIFG